MKKISCLLLALCMMTVMAASAWAEDQQIGDTPYTRNEQGIPDLKGTTITMWMPFDSSEIKWVSNYDEYATIQHLEEVLNVNLEFTHPPIGQTRDSFSIMINTGDWPDIIYGRTSWYYPGGLNMAMTDGIMMNIDEYVGDVYTPNFQRVIMDNEQYRKQFVNDDGNVLYLGARIIATEGDYGACAYNGPMIRKDFLEKAGLDVPVTIADWYEMLTAFKEMGVEIPYGWARKGADSTTASNTFVSAYGVNHGYMITKDNKIQFSPITENYKEYLTEMHKWYAEGLINPDFANQTNTDNILPMLSSDKVGALAEHLANYAQIYYPATAKNDPSKDLVAAPYPVLNEGDELSRFRPAYYGVQGDPVITTTAKDPVACVLLLDALYNPEINYILAGTEGVTFERSDASEFAITPIWYPDDTQLEMRRQHSAINLREVIDDNSTVPFYYSLPLHQEAFKLWNAASFDGNLPKGMTYTEEESDAIGKYQSDIDTYVSEMTMKFIIGLEPLDGFDAFVEEVKNLDVDSVIEAHQTCLDRYLAR